MTERPLLFRPEMVRAILEGRKTQTRRIAKPQPPCECEYVINGAQSHALCRSIRDPHIWVPPTGKSIDHRLPCPYGKPGERLWVREPFAFARHSTDYETGSEYSVFRWDKAIYGPYDPKYLTVDPRSGHPAAALFYKADGIDDEDNLPAEFSMPDGNEIGWTPSIHMPRWACRLVLEITAVRVERLQEISRADAKAEGFWPGPNGLESFDGRSYGNAELAFKALWESINGPGSWDANPWVWAIEFKKVTS